MRLFLYLSILFYLSSCTTKNQIHYLKDYDEWNDLAVSDNVSLMNFIEAGDILKIDVQASVHEAAIPYNRTKLAHSNQQNLDLLKIEGYLVDEFNDISLPVLGKINVKNLTEIEAAEKIKSLLLEGKHLTNPSVKVRRVNSKFTVLGEVKSPGTYSYYDISLNLFQALGYAGDLTIDGDRKNLKIIRNENGLSTLKKIDLTNSKILSDKYFLLKNNDVIIVSPSFSKVKSAGFIGNPSSIASMASILLSITLLITNN